MLPGMNMKDMSRIMRQLGIRQEDITASEAIIILKDGSRIIFTQPTVVKITMQGQETYQIMGATRYEKPEAPRIRDEDVHTVMEATGSSEDLAREALEAAEGDIAAAILKLQEE